ncbi:predicted protein [Streptomyces viridosporus ATCC 14672]|uniref:Predicted protein n=1 Tax=Streptomyces viridosporus (strain ATCC 14672 / DSM 40746 / JCM 4963 / KCTC 9882 / NRRL B-12104 / FH 1290) TaxID=566461 RepID=D6A763_STRV1|nr:predicted protein [Streptomyces viridosporus ATCC 14672]
MTEKLSKALDDLGDHVGKKLPDAITDLVGLMSLGADES